MPTAIEKNPLQSVSDTLKLTPEVRIPSTPAKQTSEFFDSINNLDPIKFSPPTAGESIQSDTIHEG